MAEPGKKKIVRAESTAPTDGAVQSEATGSPTWTPTPEAKGQATRLRLIAAAMWLVAIVGELVAIFVVLRKVPETGFTTSRMIVLIVMILVIGALAIGGSFLWKKANRLDPASKSDTVRFFVQNQLGAIIAIIAFLPLIIMIFTNKDMDGKQKGIAGTIGILVAAAAVLMGINWNPPSTEQYALETNIVQQLTGKDVVYWTKSGKVFHVCSDVPDVNKESKDGNIYEGSVAKAHAEGKERLTQRWKSEAVNYCGYTQAEVDAADPDMASNPPASLEPAGTPTP